MRGRGRVVCDLQFDSASSLQRAWSPAMDVSAYITEVVATPRLADFMYKCHWNIHTSCNSASIVNRGIASPNSETL
nr:MAG TPA: hypothetical protein [Caudoviricetes sp.]